MKLFLSKVWGFENPCGPLAFNSDGRRKSALRDLEQAGEGSRVILVGTQGVETDEGDRERVLGMMEPSRETVATLDFPVRADPRLRNVDGNYKWPFGVLNRRAWEFPGKPELAAITRRPFYMDAVTGIVPLTDAEAEAVLKERHDEVQLLRSIATDTRLYGFDDARRRGAPPPSTTRHGIMHMRDAPASTYLMEIAMPSGRVVAHKIGWAFDFKARMREFNKVSLPGLDGVRYRAKIFEHWQTARLAFGMEQALLRQFSAACHPGNREVIHGVGFGVIEDAWNTHVRLTKMAAPISR